MKHLLLAAAKNTRCMPVCLKPTYNVKESYYPLSIVCQTQQRELEIGQIDDIYPGCDMAVPIF